MREPGFMTDQASATDEQLLQGYARLGDEEALSLLVSRHWATAHRLAYRILGEPESAEDAAQDAFVRLMRGAARFEAGRPFGPWFRTLVLNAARNARASRSARRRHESRARGAAIEPVSPEARALAAEAGEHLASLPFDVRVPLVLHFYEGCSYGEVASATGCPRSTAQSRIEKGLERLRASLAGAGCVLAPAQVGRLLAPGPVPAAAAPVVAALAERARRASRIRALGLAGAPLALIALAVVATPLGTALATALATALTTAPTAALSTASTTARATAPLSKAGAPAPTGSRADPGPSPDGFASTPSPADPAAPPRSGRGTPGGLLVTVLGRDGAPVEDARVWASLPGDGRGATARYPERALADDVLLRATTDREGHASLEGAGKRVVVHARRGPDERSSAPLTLPAAGELELRLRSPEEHAPGRGAIVFRLLTPAGPLANARVDGSIFIFFPAASGLAPGENGAPNARLELATDADGRCALQDAWPGEYHVSFEAPGWRSRRVDLRLDSPVVLPVEVPLEASVTIVGRVLGPGRGAAVSVAALRDGTVAGSARLDPDGHYAISGLTPAGYRVRASADGFARVEADVAGAGDAPLIAAPDLVLGLGSRVTGRAVTGSGLPVPGALVLVARSPGDVLASARSLADGSFVVSGLPARTPLDLSLTAAPAKTPALSRTIELPDSGELALGDLGLPVTRARLTGHVFGPDGQPTVAGRVSLHGSEASRDALTDGEGAFVLDGIEPDRYELTATQGELVLVPETCALEGESRVERTLTLVRGATVEGTIRPAPAAGALVVVACRVVADDAHSLGSSAIDAAGHYAIAGLPPGHYRLLLRGTDQQAELDLGAAEHATLDFAGPGEATGKLGVRVIGDPGEAVLTATLYRGSLLATPIPDETLGSIYLTGGAGVFDRVPPGPLGVVVSLGKVTIFREGLVVQAGATLPVTLTLPAGATGSIEGRVEPGAKGVRPGVVALGDGVRALATIKDDGTFSLEGIPAGEYQVVAARGGSSFAGAVRVTVEGGRVSGPVVLAPAR
jgi:RNA polymerase sigma-70 factor (ECF subfamily)